LINFSADKEGSKFVFQEFSVTLFSSRRSIQAKTRINKTLSRHLISIPMKKLILLTAIFLLAPFILTAQWSTNPAVNNVICNLSGEQAIPKVACCTNGDTYIAFFSNETGNYDVRLQRLDVMGNPLWAANGILISSNPSMSWLTDWDMTADPAGYCVIAVMDIRNGNNNIYGYRIAPDGSFAWSANGVTLSNNMAFNAAPKVTTTLAGNAIFAWQADSVIIMQKIGPTGTFLWGTSGKTVAPSGASSSHSFSWPQLMAIGTDEFLMKYFEDTGSGLYPTRYIWVQKYDANGLGVWAAPAPVSLAGSITLWTQILSFINDNSDGCFIAWHDDRDGDTRSNSWVQHVSSTGTVTLGTNGTEVCNFNSNNHFYPYAVLPQGSTDVYVFWNEMNSLQTQFGIYGQKISSAGALQWGTTGTAFIPISSTDVTPLAAKPYTTDMVVFFDQYVGSTSQLLKAMRITPAGTFVWAGNSVNISSVVSAKVHTDITNLNNNQWILAWEDDRDAGVSNIYAQNLKPTGDLGPVGPLTYGNISGHVTLSGGTGNVTAVTVAAGTYNTHPDAGGNYTLTNVLTGTYTVNAMLAGYSTGTVTGVVVVENLTTPNVDFTLNYIPVTGFITGTVTLNGGSGNVTQVTVTAGTYTTNPNSSGIYSLEVPGGTYTVTGSLPGYSSGVVPGVTVINGQTTPNVNLTLNPVGSIQGQVTLNGGSGNVTQTIVAAGTYTSHPDSFGNYGMDVPIGTYNVTASLSGYETGLVANVVVNEGQATTGVNFTLEPILFSGTIEGMVTLNGGSGIVSQAIVRAGSYMTNPDVTGHYFLSVEAGSYDVVATLNNYAADTVFGVNVTIGQTTSGIDLILDPILGISRNTSSMAVTAIPNPTGPDGKFRFTISSPGSYNLEVIDLSGRIISAVRRSFDPGTREIMMNEFSLTVRGIYYFRISGNGVGSGCRFILNDTK
jgi:hypothetical protein